MILNNEASSKSNAENTRHIISCVLGMIILEQKEADEVFDQGPLIQRGDHEDSLVVLQVRNLNTQEALNTASPNLL